MREIFVPKNFNAEHMAIIEHAIELLEENRAGGYDVTLRSLYYAFISEERWFPNTLQSYKRFGDIIGKARLAGLIDWSLMEDRNREVEELASWRSPTHVMEAVADQYREDLWIGQGRRVHVRIEKDAVAGWVRPVCERWRVPFLACRGNTSLSEAYAAGKLFAEQFRKGIWPIVLYLGDHDPSGIDMTRDNEERLSMFAGFGVELRRVALNIDQVEDWRLPGNPAKTTDSRSAGYRARFGDESWELDAMGARRMEQVIEREISALIDHDIWAERVAEEDHHRSTLQAIHNRWDEVEEMFGEGDEE